MMFGMFPSSAITWRRATASALPTISLIKVGLYFSNCEQCRVRVCWCQGGCLDMDSSLRISPAGENRIPNHMASDAPRVWVGTSDHISHNGDCTFMALLTQGSMPPPAPLLTTSLATGISSVCMASDPDAMVGVLAARASRQTILHY